MFNFCYGKYSINNCLHWAQRLEVIEVIGLMLLFFIALMIVLRIFNWIFGDIDLW